MNHPYYNNIHEKFGKKKILAHQQDAIQKHVACLKEQAVIVGVIMGICSLVLILVAWSAEGNLTTRLILTAIGIALLLIPLCPAAIYWSGKKKYAYILNIETPKTEPKQMRCAKVKIWSSREKFYVDIMGVWLFSDTGETYLYLYPRPCRDETYLLGFFADNTVRKQIKATYTGRFVRFSCYEGTNVIQCFDET